MNLLRRKFANFIKPKEQPTQTETTPQQIEADMNMLAETSNRPNVALSDALFIGALGLQRGSGKEDEK